MNWKEEFIKLLEADKISTDSEIDDYADEHNLLAEQGVECVIDDEWFKGKTMNKEIEEMMLAVPQKIVAYDGNPAGQHLYGEQRHQIAETLYNAGYHKIDENCTVITKDELEEYKRQAVKEFAEKVKEYINNKVIADFDDSESVKYYTIDLDEFESEIDELLKEYEK